MPLKTLFSPFRTAKRRIVQHIHLSGNGGYVQMQAAPVELMTEEEMRSAELVQEEENSAEALLAKARYNLYICTAFDEIAQTCNGKTLHEAMKARTETLQNRNRVAVIKAVLEKDPQIDTYKNGLADIIKASFNSRVTVKVNKAFEAVSSAYQDQGLDEEESFNATKTSNELVQGIAAILGKENLPSELAESIEEVLEEAGKALQEGKDVEDVAETFQNRVDLLLEEPIASVVSDRLEAEVSILEKAAGRIERDALSGVQGSDQEKIAAALEHLQNLVDNKEKIKNFDFSKEGKPSEKVAQQHLGKLQLFQEELDAERAEKTEPFYRGLAHVLSTATREQQRQIIESLRYQEKEQGNRTVISGTLNFFELMDFNRDELVPEEEQQEAVEAQLYNVMKNTEVFHTRKFEPLALGNTLVGEVVRYRNAGKPSHTQDELKRIMPEKEAEIDEVFEGGFGSIHEPLATEVKLISEPVKVNGKFGQGVLAQAEELAVRVAYPLVSSTTPSEELKKKQKNVVQAINEFKKNKETESVQMYTAKVTKSNAERLFPDESTEQMLAGVLLRREPKKLVGKLVAEKSPRGAVEKVRSEGYEVNRPIEKLITHQIYAPDMASVVMDTITRRNASLQDKTIAKNIRLDDALAQKLLVAIHFSANPEEEVEGLLQQAAPEDLFDEDTLEDLEESQIKSAKKMLGEVLKKDTVKQQSAKQLLADVVLGNDEKKRTKQLLSLAGPEDFLDKSVLEGGLTEQERTAKFKVARNLISEELLKRPYEERRPRFQKIKHWFSKVWGRENEGNVVREEKVGFVREVDFYPIDAETPTRYLAPDIGESQKFDKRGKRFKEGNEEDVSSVGEQSEASYDSEDERKNDGEEFLAQLPTHFSLSGTWTSHVTEKRVSKEVPLGTGL